MNHLGEQISALIDGELTGLDLDRANAHLAACGRCRAEAAELRQLKRDLRALFDFGGDDRLTGRLLAMADPDVPDGPDGPDGPNGPNGLDGPDGQVPSPRPRRERDRRERSADNRPPHGRAPARTPARSRGRYVLWSGISLFVVGVGTAAFTMGGAGGAASPGPKITPQLEMFSVEHAMVSGDVPFPDPTQPAGGVTSP